MLLPTTQQLQTQFVFIDTEAFKRAHFDWNGKAFSRLADFAKEGHLRLLITDITKREVCNKLHEWLAEVTSAVSKHEILLQQLGINIVQTLNAAEAYNTLESRFSQFLKATKAIDVPITATLDAILSDYFSRRPPFSAKKKAEFPDAAVIASLQAWCTQRSAKLYVVSGDPDMKACCTLSGPLIHAASVEEIISQATVSKEVHDLLQEVLFQSETLSEWFAKQLRELMVVRGDMRLRRFSGAVYRADDVSVHSVNVLDREGLTFTCEIEFEARLAIRLEFEREELEYDEYWPVSTMVRKDKEVYRGFSAELVVKFDPENPHKTELESVHVFKDDAIELDIDDVMAR